MNIIILLLAFLLLVALLYAERRESQRGILLTKPLLSALFVAVLFSSPHAASVYFYLIFAGMCLCWLGDLFLVFFFKEKFFKLGLVSFLLGHVLYAIAFLLLGGLQITTWIALPALGVASGYIFARFRPFLGKMLGPVLVYITMISVMLLGASSLAGNPTLPVFSRSITLFGALSFYISDIFVARQRFVHQAHINRFFGLALYYLGQFSIAFGTVGMVL